MQKGPITTMKPLKITLGVIAVVQFVFGVLFVFLPGQFAPIFHLPVAPTWVNWLLVMGGARFLGMGYGMLVAIQDPIKHRAWINAMIGVQALDWLATIYSLVTGAISLSQASTATFLPVLFIAALLVFYPRSQPAAQKQPELA